MKKLAFIILLTISAGLALPFVSQDSGAQGIFTSQPGSDKPQGIGDDACRKAIALELAKVQRKFRGVLYGYPKAISASGAIVRFSSVGDAWIQTDKSSWRSVAPGFENTTWSDELMDQNDEFIASIWPDGRRGIFRTRRMLTSELIPYLAQSARALQCEADTVCETAGASFSLPGGATQTVSVKPAGCLQEQRPTLAACQFGSLDSNQLAQADIFSFCPTTVDGLLQREGDLLKMAVEYDAAYRSLLQFSGNFDLFMEEFRWPLTFTIRQAAALIGQLNRIPCFLSSCDDDPNYFSSSPSAP
jgi:hypothetical protein